MRSKGERLASPSKDQLSQPGPGAYDTNKNAVKERTPNTRFGTDKRKGLVGREEKQKPGPG